MSVEIGIRITIVSSGKVTILNKFQGKGIGNQIHKQLLYKAVIECKKQVYIVTDTGNEHNIYLQLGFQMVGMEIEIFYPEFHTTV